MTQLALKSELTRCTPRLESEGRQVLSQCLPRQVQGQHKLLVLAQCLPRQELQVLAQCIPRQELRVPAQCSPRQELWVLAQCSPRQDQGRRKLLVLAQGPQQVHVRRTLQVQARSTSNQGSLMSHRFETKRGRNVHNDQPWSTQSNLFCGNLEPKWPTKVVVVVVVVVLDTTLTTVCPHAHDPAERNEFACTRRVA